jgi:putative ABC transport system permease protein
MIAACEGGLVMESLWHDLRYALRSLRQSRVFTVVALLTLALGIGANTAIFTVVKSVLLEPLPFPEPERIVVVLESNPEAGFEKFTLSPPNFRDIHDQNQVFSAMAAFAGDSIALTGNGPPERLRARRVTGEFFRVYGSEPLHGRVIGTADDQPDAPPVAVLGHGFWQRRFAGDAAVVGRTLQLDGTPTTVIGVMPAHFSTTHDLYVPLALDYEQADRGSHWLIGLARLAPGVTLPQARDNLRAITAGLAEAYPESNTGWSAVAEPLHELMVTNVRPALLVLTLAVGLVLLIACANVANLLLSRMALREREIAVRTALGAGRWQLMRQLLIESILLSVGGGLLGFLLAIRGTTLLVALNASDLPRSASIGVDLGVLGFTLVLSLVTGVVFGLLPAFRASRANLQQTLREGGRSSTGMGGQRLRTTLVLAEVSVALVLLIAAGLLIRSFTALVDVDPGFVADNVLTVQLNLPEARYAEEEARSAFYHQLFERLHEVPGVEQAAGVFPMPLTGSGYMLRFFVEGRPQPPPNQELVAHIREVAAGYIETLGIPVYRGRTVSTADDAGAEPVVVLNQSAANRFWPDQDPLGQRITFDDLDAEDLTWWRVVGVVGDVHHESLATATEPEIYRPLLQAPNESVTAVLRTSAAPTSVIDGVRNALIELDPELPLYNIRTLQQIVDESVAQPRFSSLLLGLFAGLALLLAAIGIYGLISYSVTHRLREIGVRLALGAGRGNILRLVLRQGMTPVVIGAVLGIVAALAATRLLASLVFDVSPADPLTFAAVTTLLLVIALLACLLPALRAIRVEPMVVLRDE